jgi:hypothetical protein
MSEKVEQTDWSAWFSTYGILTAERILERFNLHLPHDELALAVKNPLSPYYQLLRVPLKNVFNGIILAQASDYQAYAQKLFVDYLLSGEEEKDAESPGAVVREDLERERVLLIEAGDAFRQLEQAHQLLIAESQAVLADLARDLNRFVDDAGDIALALADYLERVQTMNIDLRSMRRQFYDVVLRVTELITLLPDYRPDINNIEKNRSSLQFDALIGEA